VRVYDPYRVAPYIFIQDGNLTSQTSGLTPAKACYLLFLAAFLLVFFFEPFLADFFFAAFFFVAMIYSFGCG
jgi:hypothetical protein